MEKMKNPESQEPMTFYPTLEEWSDLPRSVLNTIYDVFDVLLTKYIYSVMFLTLNPKEHIMPGLSRLLHLQTGNQTENPRNRDTIPQILMFSLRIL